MEKKWKTIVLSAPLIVANWGWFAGETPRFQQLQTSLQYDGAAIRQGELWRLVTFNLAHWDARHFLLNTLVFVGLGLLCERDFGRWYAPLLLASGLAVGVGMFLLLPAQTIARGLSGVVACQLAAALALEFHRAYHDRRRWWMVFAAAALFAFWLYYNWRTMG